MTDYIPSNLDLAITLVSHTTVNSVLYTFCFILYCLCVRLSYSRTDGKIIVLTIILASVIIICATINVALINQYGRIIYVDYNTLPGGPLGLSAQAHGSTVSHINTIAMSVELCLAMGVLLWRVWVVYSGSRNRLLVPIVSIALLFYLVNIVSALVQIVYGWPPLAGTLQNINRAWDIISGIGFTAGIASTIVMNLMITARLMLIRKKHIKLMGDTDIAAQYLGIVAVLVESYAFKTAWNISFAIAYILRNPPAHNFFGITGFQIEVISYFLLLYRVLSGRAWNRETQNQLSTLQWQRSIQRTNHNLGTEVDNINANCTDADLSIINSRATNV